MGLVPLAMRSVPSRGSVGSTPRITPLSVNSSFKPIANPTLPRYGTDFIPTELHCPGDRDSWLRLCCSMKTLASLERP